ncbi:unnamed protein product [Lactuca saligna]|uniref:CST complex subunit CTC1 n=1 Tax=Lactuca saligna TaxID=75948 RepID=A0AA35YX90_LACSI|nr:unnamed protein product [Lactuca saligna]
MLISGMKKKMVFLGEGKSLMMYVTTEKAILHLPVSKSKRAMNGRNIATREKGLCSVHTGSITGLYMQGMVIELDQKVLLLLMDHPLLMPHGLRVGATITVRNFHLEDPKFSWTKVKVFGSCYKTSIRVNIFSPIENGCYQSLQSRSLLRKFIESLSFSARLWVLLVVSSLKKKFSGILSEMEILGSKHMEGLVQKYSSSCLPLSVFRFRHGVLTEYCQHELYGCGKEIDYTPPKLVVPISNLISQFCGGKSHDQPIRTILKSEDLNIVLLGSLKISEYSRRLQLVDATGSIDIVIPDLSSDWSIKDIYEINDFSVVIEGFPRQIHHLQSLNNDPFSCKNIFNHFQLSRRKQFTIYIYCYIRDTKSRNHILCPRMDKEKYKELESGNFHLLYLMHKFPLQQKFAGDDVATNNLSVYVEAIAFPWNLVLCKRERDSESVNMLNGRVVNMHMQEDSFCKRAARKLLLEFKSDSFSKYELLRIGGYYLVKHDEKDVVCNSSKECSSFVNTKSHFWTSVSFCNDDEASFHNLNEIEICPDIYANVSVTLSSICIHVLIDNNMVKVYSSLSQQSYPIGFGRGVKAKFYRVLLTSEGNVLKLTPASFIEINSITTEDDLNSNNDSNDTSPHMDTTSSSTNSPPATLISEMIHFSHHKQILRIHCKVVAIHVLVLEKNNELLHSNVKKFPLAGFLIDDGSSTCCCWSDNESVITSLLGLTLKHSRTSLMKILDAHDPIVVKNYGCFSDYSCVDVKVSGSLKESDEQFLKSILLHACSTNTWNVVGSMLDLKGVNDLEERLRKLDLVMLPLQHIWVSHVSHLDTLSEGRSILQQLLNL